LPDAPDELTYRITTRTLDQHLKICILLVALGTVILLAASHPLSAQPRTGWGYSVDGLTVFQGSADLSGGGDFTANRTFLRAGTLYTFENGDFVGFSASIGEFNYDFGQVTNQPWTDIRDIRVSVPMRFGLNETTSVFFAPQVRWDYQSGASAPDGQTYGVFSGISWRVNEALTIGPAFGAFSQLEDSSTDFFPALLVDWEINDRWNVSTGSGLGATTGPGLTLSYAHNDKLSFSLAARSERVRFRLDGSGPAPNGVGEDKSIPVVLTLRYEPNPAMSFTAFAGAEFDGRLTLDDFAGNEISRQSYDTAPLAGLAFRVRF